MMKGSKCKVCGEEATKYWHGGQSLCDKHYLEWDKRAKEIREGKEGWF